MDELDFQRKAYAEPNCQDVDFVQHKNKSPKKQPLLDELILLDQHLKRAINIMPPPGLAERIESNQLLLQHQLIRKKWMWITVGVTVFIATAASLFFLMA